MNTGELSAFKVEMLKRGFTYIKEKDHFINQEGVIAVEIFHPSKPLIFGYSLILEKNNYTSFIFQVPIRDI